MHIGLHVKYLLFLSDFIETLNFSTDFSKEYSTVKVNKNPSLKNRFSQSEDRRMDVTKLIVAVRNFAKAPKNQ
jgi:hypothetical protein